MYGKNMYLSFLNEEIYEDAEFNIEPLDKVGITGVNGAGKTTTFRMITNLIDPTSGSITLDGKKIDYERIAKVVLDEFRAGKIGKITLEKVER